VSSTLVRVYTVELDRPGAEVERLRALLPPEERDVSSRTQVARAAARIVLGDVLGTDARSVPISRRCEHCGHPTHGRPVVGGDVPVSFNVSHSNSLALVAVIAADARVGVDIEAVRTRPRLDALAKRVFGAGEHAAWLELPDQEARLCVFLETWTRTEAYLKARGVGITTSLRAVPRRPEGWTVTTLEPRDGFVAAVAADRPALEIEERELALGVMPSGGTGD
jgi:phosphopantetheinyl transferase